MKKVLAVGICFVLLCGCNVERKRTTEEQNKLTHRFVKLMDAGKTTREQEQAMVRAVAGYAYEIDRSIRGTQKADAARKIGQIAGETGIDPTKPLDLDSLKSDEKPNQ